MSLTDLLNGSLISMKPRTTMTAILFGLVFMMCCAGIVGLGIRNEGDSISGSGVHGSHALLARASRAARRSGYRERRSSEGPPYMIFIGNLPYGSGEPVIKHIFYGLDVKNIELARDPETGRLRGFAFVEFYDQASMDIALERDGIYYLEHELDINVAKHRPKNQRRGQRGGRRFFRDQSPPKNFMESGNYGYAGGPIS